MMINERFYSDIGRRPDLFWFQNPISTTEKVDAVKRWNAPPDLLDFWSTYGGGLMFDGEHMLRPFVDAPSIDFITEREHAKGLPSGLTIFHTGECVSAFEGNSFHTFDRESLKWLESFTTLDDWYVKAVRSSWGPLYGLMPS